MTSAVATPHQVRTRSRAIALHADLVAGGAAALFALVLLVATWSTWGNLNQDTGYDVVAGARLADGDVPYVDYLYYYGPLGPALAALAVLVGGEGFGPQAALGIALTALILAATYVLARKQSGPLGGFLATALVTAVAFIPANFSYVLPHTLAAPLGTLALLGLLLALAQAAGAAAGRGWLLAIGAAVGLSTLTKPEYVLAAAVAVVAWLVVRRHASAAPWRDAALVAAPAVAIPVVVYGPLALAAGLGDLLFENLYPVDTLAVGGDAILRNRMPMTVSSFAELGVRLALYAAGVAAMVIVARLIARGGRARVAGVVLVALGALALCASLVVNQEAVRHGLQFVYGWVPLGAAAGAVWIVLRERRSASPWSADAQLTFASTVVLAVLSFTHYNGFFLHSENSQMAVYYAPFIAVLLARLHLVEVARGRAAVVVGAVWLLFLVAAGALLTLSDANDETSTVHGPGGSITAPASDAAAFQGAVDAIAANTRPGEPILAAPFLTSLYVLAERPDPVSAIVLQPGTYPTAADEQAAIAEFERDGVRFAITSRRSLVEHDQTTFGDSFGRELDGWIPQQLHTPANTERLWLRAARPRRLDPEVTDMKRVGITGAAGFIGSHLCERLLSEDVEVVGVDDLSMGTMANLAACLDHPGFRFEHLDCTRRRDLRAAFDRCDAIVHLAAQKIPRYGGALMTLESNVAGVNAACSAALSLDADIVIASTSDVYGNAMPPFAEDGNLVLGPPTTRRWAYAVSKLYDEHVALALAEERGLRVSILRLFGSYGPHNHPSWWGGPQSAFIETLLDGGVIDIHGDGQQVRTFTYVSDTVDGFVRTLRTPEARGEVINIGGTQPTTILNLATAVHEVMGIGLPLRARFLPYEALPGKYQDVRMRIPDTAKARRILDFTPRIPLHEGLELTLGWHRERRAALLEELPA